MTSYSEFLARKARRAQQVGRDVELSDIHSSLHEWQARGVQWAVGTGRAALMWDTGLGKTRAQLEWARLSADRVLVICPLSVARQTVREAEKIDIDARYVRDGLRVRRAGVYVTNYEMVEHFDPAAFGAVVLDESSCLKHVDAKRRRLLTDLLRDVPLRLACSATPAPNDAAELCNHAEFLGVMSRQEMLAAYFINDEKDWRLKGHAAGSMFEWMSTWAMALRRPSDMGYPDGAYELPPLEIVPEVVAVDLQAEGQLFPTTLGGVGGRAKVRKATLGVRVEHTVRLVNGSEREARVYAGLDPGQPRAHSGISTPDGGSQERPASSELRGVCGDAGEEAGRSGRLPQAESAPASGELLQADGRATSRDAGGGLRGVRSQAGEAPHRSLPQDGRDARGPVSAMQSGIGASTGRSGADPGPAFVPDESAWIIWCALNDEQEALARAFGDRAISITGSLSADQKEERLFAWLNGERPILISKPSICGWGLNLQRAHKMVFVGLGDSYEAYYQCIRRCYRFGQTAPVRVYVVVSELEQQIVANVRRKEVEAQQMTACLVEHMNHAIEMEGAAA